MIESGNYWAYDQEMRLIENNKWALQNYITNYLTDVWCGNGQKAIKLLEGSRAAYTVSYLASDYSASMIDLAEKNILEKLPGIKLGNHQIMRPGNELLTNSLEENTYFWVGWTIGNFQNNQDISNQIKNMSNSWTLKGNRIILSYFDIPKTSEELEKTKALYSSKEAEAWIFNGLQNIGVDTTKFDYNVEYNPSDTCIYVWIKANEDAEITSAWKTIHIKKWEIYNVIKSKRFSLEEIKSILKQSWAKLEHHISDGDISLIVAKKDPKYFHKTMKIAALTSLLLAGTLAGWIWGYQFSQHKEKAEITERNRDNAKKNLQNKDLKQWFHQIFTQAKDIDSKVKLLETTTNNVYFYFSKIYDCWKYEDIIKGMIQSELRRGDNINTVNADVNYTSQIMCRFIKDVFVPNNFEALNNLWIDVNPYKEMIQQTQAFRNTANIDWTLELGYDEFGRNSDGQNHVWASWVSININKMIPYTYVTDRSMYPMAPHYKAKPDTLGTRLTGRDIKAKILWNFYVPSSDQRVFVLKVTLQKDWKDMDLVLFSTDQERGWKKYILDQNLAKEFLNTWAK